ncbi:hypothetical protein A374_14295 [Fictibacillus macauensis ZFHKF-1]|uniref:Uncharacterized protein n=1 Tax=Fictibacillus macauensis ZFHKF-1 TaxID=1196324 RepID=I8AHE7_9BACL|nr:zinc-ribbon domain-containing protein [Fictibacillus macauensis]EIT84869.1 hypothetical protein A374_14295 [Fictibacillus macauensis ZFHKF-1]
MNFCKECGTELPKGKKFCTNCGAHNETVSVEKTPPKVEMPASPSPPAVPSFSATSEMKSQQPKKKKRGLMWLLISIATVLVLVIGGIVFYKVMAGQTGPEAAIKEWQQAIDHNDPEKIKDLLNESQSKTKATTEDAKSFIKLAIKKDSFLAKEISQLEKEAALSKGSATIAVTGSADEHKWLSLKKDGKKAFFFDTYKVNVNPVDVEIFAMHDSKLTLDGRSVKLSKDSILPSVLPGEHKVKATYTSKFANISEEFDLSLSKLEKGKARLNAYLTKADYLRLRSNIPDAHIFINGKDSGKTIMNQREIGALPSDSTKIHLEKTFGNKVLKSETVTLTNSSSKELLIDYKPLIKKGDSKRDEVIKYLKLYMDGFVKVKTAVINRDQMINYEIYADYKSPAYKTINNARSDALMDNQKRKLLHFKVDKIDAVSKYVRIKTIEEYEVTTDGKKSKKKEKLTYYLKEKDGLISIYEISPTKK